MKQVKLNISNFLIAIILLVGVEPIWGQVKEKRVDKTFTVNSSTRLSIDNRFGKVHINTWDQNKIEAQVVVEVDGSGDAAREILDRIKIDVSESTGEIRLETDIHESRRNRNNQRFEINYTISMPKKNPLQVDHRHGDIYLDNIDGPVDLDLAHGQIVAEALSGKSRISLQHGNGGRIGAIGSGSLSFQHYQRLRIGKLGSIDLEIAHASADIEEAGDLDFELRHSKVAFGSTGMVTLDMQHSKFEAESARSVHSDAQHSSLDIDRVTHSIEFDGNHSQVEIGKLSRNFTMVDFEGNHSFLRPGIRVWGHCFFKH